MCLGLPAVPTVPAAPAVPALMRSFTNMITLTLILMLNIFQSFPPAAITNCQIARYDMINLRNNRAYDFTLIKTDVLIIEITKMKVMSTDSQYSVGEIEQRSVYDLQNKTITSYTIMHDKSALSYIQKTFAEHLPAGYKIEDENFNGQRTMSFTPAAPTSIFPFKVTMSDSYPNFHSSAIFYPEVQTLPETIEYKEVRYTLSSVITDDAEKLKILDAFKLDVESFKRIIGEQELRNFTKEVFGTSLEELPAVLKRLSEEGKL